MTERRFVPLQPRGAMDALAARGLKLDPSFSWLEAWQEMHADSFTVAKSAGFDILNDIFLALMRSLAEGTTFREFAKQLTEVLQNKGWWGQQLVRDPETGEMIMAQLGSIRRLETIFDANLRVSYAAGHWKRFEESKSYRPYLRYVCILDNRTRPTHALHHNLVLPVDHPYWDVWACPNGWNCRCTLQNLTQGEVEQFIAEGIDLKFEPPVIPMRHYVNKRTGEATDLPEGIDPGWGYNPGKAGYEAIIAAQLAGKELSAPWLKDPDA